MSDPRRFMLPRPLPGSRMRPAPACDARGHRAAEKPLGAASARRRAGPAAERGARASCPPALELERSAQGAGHARRAPRGWMPTGVASTGTSQASASSTARPKPSRSEGTSTALAALTHSGTRSGVDRAERQQLDAGRDGERERAVVALLRRAPGRRGTAGRAARVEAELARACARGSGRKRSMSTPQGSTSARSRGAAAGQFPRERRRTRPPADRSAAARRRSAARVRGCATSVPWTVSARTRAGTARAGQAVRPKWACTTSKRGRGGRRLSVERRAVAAAQLDRRARERARAGANSYSSTSRPSSVRSAATWSRTKLPAARDGRRRAACWRPPARARIRDRSALE